MSAATLDLRTEMADDDLSAAMALGRSVRIAEALLFAAREPLDERTVAAALPAGVDPAEVIAHLQRAYAARGVNLVAIAGKWAFRTAPDLGHLMRVDVEEPRRLSRAAVETLAIIAYHQPVTRAEIEDIRGVATAKGTLDVLLEAGWVRMRGRRRTPGRPITFGTTEGFLSHFGLASIGDLPGLDELKSAGMFDGRLPSGPMPQSPASGTGLAADEDPLEADPAEIERDIRLDAAEPALAEEDEASSGREPRIDPLDGERRR